MPAQSVNEVRAISCIPLQRGAFVQSRPYESTQHTAPHGSHHLAGKLERIVSCRLPLCLTRSRSNLGQFVGRVASRLWYFSSPNASSTINKQYYATEESQRATARLGTSRSRRLSICCQRLGPYLGEIMLRPRVAFSVDRSASSSIQPTKIRTLGFATLVLQTSWAMEHNTTHRPTFLVLWRST